MGLVSQMSKWPAKFEVIFLYRLKESLGEEDESLRAAKEYYIRQLKTAQQVTYIFGNCIQFRAKNV